MIRTVRRISKQADAAVDVLHRTARVAVQATALAIREQLLGGRILLTEMRASCVRAIYAFRANRPTPDAASNLGDVLPTEILEENMYAKWCKFGAFASALLEWASLSLTGYSMLGLSGTVAAVSGLVVVVIVTAIVTGGLLTLKNGARGADWHRRLKILGIPFLIGFLLTIVTGLIARTSTLHAELAWEMFSYCLCFNTICTCCLAAVLTHLAFLYYRLGVLFDTIVECDFAIGNVDAKLAYLERLIASSDGDSERPDHSPAPRSGARVTDTSAASIPALGLMLLFTILPVTGFSSTLLVHFDVSRSADSAMVSRSVESILLIAEESDVDSLAIYSFAGDGFAGKLVWTGALPALVPQPDTSRTYPGLPRGLVFVRNQLKWASWQKESAENLAARRAQIGKAIASIPSGYDCRRVGARRCTDLSALLLNLSMQELPRETPVIIVTDTDAILHPCSLEHEFSARNLTALVVCPGVRHADGYATDLLRAETRARDRWMITVVPFTAVSKLRSYLSS